MDYMGTTDDTRRAWLLNFRNILTAAASTYMVSGPDVSAITAAVDDFVDKLAIVQSPGGRNSVSTAAKNAARAVCVDLCRQFAMQIKVNAGISDQAKIDAGVRPVNTSRVPVPPPTEQAVITVLGGTYGSHTLRYLDPDGGESSRKPFGVTNLQIYRALTAEPVEDVKQTAFYWAYRKNPMAVAFDNADDGLVATYFARWADAKGQVGPWSMPVSLRVAA